MGKAGISIGLHQAEAVRKLGKTSTQVPPIPAQNRSQHALGPLAAAAGLHQHQARTLKKAKDAHHFLTAALDTKSASTPLAGGGAAQQPSAKTSSFANQYSKFRQQMHVSATGSQPTLNLSQHGLSMNQSGFYPSINE